MTIDIFADIACPWCYVGEHRLAEALRRTGVEAELRWWPFQLQPDIPAEGLPWEPFAKAKFGGMDRARAAYGHLEQAAGDAIRFDFDNLASAPNTTDAHRLMLLAQTQQRIPEMAESLFAGYFTEGRNLNDIDTLVHLAERAGFPGEGVRAFLASDDGKGEVEHSQQVAQQYGIQGVPFYIIAGERPLSGAQPVEAFEAALVRFA